MQTGTALIAPQGFQSFDSGITYHFLRNDRVTQTALLVIFSHAPATATLVTAPRNVFENGLLGKHIVEVGSQTGLPPFLETFEGFDFESFDQWRPNAKKSIRRIVEDRLLAISPLLDREMEILQSPSPEREISQYAHPAGLNTGRVRLWFFTYLCFGRNIWALLPHYFRCGQWDRLTRPDGPKFGRPSIARGPQSGARLDSATIDTMTDAYLSLRSTGKYLTHIYEEAMVTKFHAAIVTTKHNQKRFISSDGTRIPTYDQFRYQVRKKLGQAEVQRSLYGNSRFRRSKAEHVGTFASAVSNLLERVEADGYYCADLPKSYVDDVALPPLCIVRGVDTASGLRIGIGASLGKEDSKAYDGMLFCAAISKKIFCAIFCIEIEEHEWPSQGLPAHYITDRGPGIKREPGEDSSHGRIGAVGMTIRELTPSGQGQSKAIVESAQRRTVKLEEPAQYSVSDLSPYRMMQREIMSLLRQNRSADAQSRMTPDMINAGVLPTPLGVWKYLDSRGRNDGQTIPFAEAVRRFLTSVKVRVDRQGVWLKHQKYNSNALRNTGLLSRISNTGTQSLKAFVYPLCIRHIWVEVGGLLVEVNAELALRDDDTQLYRTFADLEQEDRKVKQSKAGFNRLNKVFGGELESILAGINEELWKKAA